MKKTFILAVLMVIVSLPASSQDADSVKKDKKHRKSEDEFKTLFGHNRPGGAYGAFTVGYSEIDNNQAVIFGGKFEWIVGHTIGFGFGGNGFINEYHYDPQLQTDVFLTGGYGGFYIEPIFLPKFPVHLSFPILLGAGGISYITEEPDSFNNMIEDSEAFLIAEPGAELEFNITRNFRFAVGATYRFTTQFNVGSSESTAVSSSSLENWSFMMTFKFGRF